MSAGVLNGGRKRVEVNGSSSASRSFWEDRIEIVDFEISAERKCGDLAAGAARQIRPAANRNRQRPISIGSLKERPPFPEVMAGQRELERGSSGQVAGGADF